MPLLTLSTSSNLRSLMPDFRKETDSPLLSLLSSAFSEQLGFSDTPSRDQIARNYISEMFSDWVWITSTDSETSSGLRKANSQQLVVWVEISLLGSALEKRYHRLIRAVITESIRVPCARACGLLDLTLSLDDKDEETSLARSDGSLVQSAEIPHLFTVGIENRLAYWALGMAF